MNEVPKISIIVPVYNVEKYLAKCIDSILEQTYSDFECVLIDDGSPDCSGALCDEYARKDNRIHVIHQKNAGVSAARNRGLDAAKGEWICFVDSDDWCAKDMLSILYSAAHENDADVVCGAALSTDGKKKKHLLLPVSGILNLPHDFPRYLHAPWGKLFSRNCILQSCARFPEEIAYAEDFFFTFTVFFSAKKVYGITDLCYYYFDNPQSVTSNLSEKNIDDKCRVLSMIEQTLAASNANSEWFDYLQDEKLATKRKCIYSFLHPNYKKWNECYPELTQFLIETSHFPKKLLYIALAKRYDWIVTVFLFLRKIKKRIFA